MFEDVVRVIFSLPELAPLEILPPRLDALFEQLQAATEVGEAYTIEDEIWVLWTEHPDPAATRIMNTAIAAMASKRFAEAQTILDELVRQQPLWPEAWNKRATLAFLQGRDAESARDIRRTLQMEPRHFGALSGFAQICLRNQQPTAALIAFEAALRINPHLASVRIAADQLRRRHPNTLH